MKLPNVWLTMLVFANWCIGFLNKHFFLDLGLEFLDNATTSMSKRDEKIMRTGITYKEMPFQKSIEFNMPLKRARFVINKKQKCFLSPDR